MEETYQNLLSIEAAQERELTIRNARESLLDFIRAHKPDYGVDPFHRQLCELMEGFYEKVKRKESPRLIIVSPPQMGKEIADDVPVWTPCGWRNHGSLAPGDEVFGEDGSIVRVMAVSPSSYEKVEIEFTDGAKIQCHPAHEWVVYDRCKKDWRILETRYMQQSALWIGERKRGGRARFQVDGNRELRTPELALPLDAYSLGAWLGDGSCGEGCITHAAEDWQTAARVEAAGFPRIRVNVHKTTGVLRSSFAGFRAKLKVLGVLRQKHIPDIYLRASVRQRLELLAGLIDTDGNVWQDNGRVTFSNCNKTLAYSVAHLVRTLGWRATIAPVPPRLSSSGIQGKQTEYQVSFNPRRPFPTAIPRKRIVKIDPVRRRRGIVSIQPCAPKRGRCIQVEGGVYLVGETLVPTHNSEIMSRSFPAWALGKDPNLYFIAGAYASDWATSLSADVQNIMMSETYRKIFPKTLLPRAPGGKGDGSQRADFFELVGAQGRYRAAGRAKGVTGRPAHCFVAGTEVTTEAGEVSIECLARKFLAKQFPRILTNGYSGFEFEDIEAISQRQVSGLYRITTTSGRVVKATGDHPFFVWNQSGPRYIEAALLAPGDPLLCAVRKDVRETGFRVSEAYATGSRQDLLLAGVHAGRSCRESLHALPMRAKDQARAAVLRRLPAALQALARGGPCGESRDLSDVLRGVRSTVARTRVLTVLREGLRRSRPFPVNVGSREPQMARGSEFRQDAPVFEENVPLYPAFDFAAGWACVPRVPQWREVERASSRRVASEQCLLEPGDALCEASPPMASSEGFYAVRDTVALVERLCEEATVYDLQVAGNHNFFANGICVHNCILIDDPLKDQFEAMSDAIREQCWGWWNPTLRTRLQDGGGVMLTLTRWHLDDMAGRMLDLAKKDPDADQWDLHVFPALLGEPECAACKKRLGIAHLAEHTCRSLAPHRFRHETLIKTRATSSPAVWNALYRGDPVALGGNILPASAWRYYGGPGQPMLPDLGQFDFIVQSWDGSFKDVAGADFCAGQVWGVRGAEMWMLDYILEQMSFTRFITAIRQMSYKWPKAAWVFVEDKANGTAAMDTLAQEISGLMPVDPKGGKIARAWSTSARLCAGNCFIPDASIMPAIKGFVDRCNVFPVNLSKSGSDDDIDAFTQAENEVKQRTYGLLDYAAQKKTEEGERVRRLRESQGRPVDKPTATMPDGRIIELSLDGKAWVYADTKIPVIVPGSE